jgi:hypothetical protein
LREAKGKGDSASADFGVSVKAKGRAGCPPHNKLFLLSLGCTQPDLDAEV